MDEQDTKQEVSVAEERRIFEYLLERVVGPDREEELALSDEESEARYKSIYPEPLP